jgi:glucose-1-phosphate adenylyltransferase
LPSKIASGGTFAYLHDDYWEDIGTIKSFYDANIALTSPTPPFNCYNEKHPIIKSPSKLPGARISNTQITHSIICEGSQVEAKEITHSILGPRTVVKAGCSISHSYIMGNDFYEPPARIARFPERLQISEDCVIQNAIIDKDVYLGRGVRLINQDNLTHYDGEQVFIRDKVIVVARGASLPDGFTL